MNDYHSCIDGGSLRFTIQPNVTASLENHQMHLHAHESICYPYTCSCFFKTEPRTEQSISSAATTGQKTMPRAAIDKQNVGARK